MRKSLAWNLELRVVHGSCGALKPLAAARPFGILQVNGLILVARGSLTLRCRASTESFKDFFCEFFFGDVQIGKQRVCWRERGVTCRLGRPSTC